MTAEGWVQCRGTHQSSRTCLFGVAQVLEKKRPDFIRERHILILLELHLQAMFLLSCMVALQEANPLPWHTETAATKATSCCGWQAAAGGLLDSPYRQTPKCSTGQAKMGLTGPLQIARLLSTSTAGSHAGWLCPNMQPRATCRQSPRRHFLPSSRSQHCAIAGTPRCRHNLQSQPVCRQADAERYTGT